jgi:hypothetical protein
MTDILELRKDQEIMDKRNFLDYYNAMEKLHPDLRDVLYYNGLVYKRQHNSELHTKNMFEEFLWVINKQFGEYIDKDWDTWNTGNGMDEELEEHYGEDFVNTEKCICTHKITNLYFIQHLPTNMTFQVGCDCVLKIDGELAEKMKIAIKRKANWKKGKICLYCSEPLTDLRKKYQRKECCDISCHHKYHYVMPFGKFKGIRLVELMCTTKGFQYINEWVKPLLAIDKNSFYKFPLFTEIVNETDLE